MAGPRHQVGVVARAATASEHPHVPPPERVGQAQPARPGLLGRAGQLHRPRPRSGSSDGRSPQASDPPSRSLPGLRGSIGAVVWIRTIPWDESDGVLRGVVRLAGVAPRRAGRVHDAGQPVPRGGRGAAAAVPRGRGLPERPDRRGAGAGRLRHVAAQRHRPLRVRAPPSPAGARLDAGPGRRDRGGPRRGADRLTTRSTPSPRTPPSSRPTPRRHRGGHRRAALRGPRRSRSCSTSTTSLPTTTTSTASPTGSG